MLRILISIALLFAYVTETKGSAEWVSFKLFGVNGSKALDFIKMSDINSVIIRNAGLHFYYSIINKITENNSLLINNLTIGNNGYLWLATPFGIEKRTNIDTIKYSYKTRNVYDVTIDFNDNKWFASDSGLIKFDNINWTLFNKENSGFPAVKIWHICTSTKGDIWTVFSDSGSIGRFDGKVWKFYNSTQTGIKALGMDIRIVSDTSGRIWLR
ncbi:MAG: hypothetical protein NT007_00725, partial [Candidatus Kapabacteria bacterium]|nr:hypothetical protein [Candidatus Kapabacteria bacterium]